jgi:hypothetical protein
MVARAGRCIVKDSETRQEDFEYEGVKEWMRTGMKLCCSMVPRTMAEYERDIETIWRAG